MKKIMFNDRFGLTDAVLEGRKTVTRRIVTDEIYGESYIDDNPPRIDEIHRPTTNSKYIKSHLSKYKVGEVIAIAQSYKYLENCGFITHLIPDYLTSVGYNNKMFVRAEIMPHQIEIIDVRVERLQDISDEDCIKEGIIPVQTDDGVVYQWRETIGPRSAWIRTPKSAYACLIYSIDGKGTWDNNPYVFRYEFKLLK